MISAARSGLGGKTKSMIILTPFIHSSGDLERINTRSLRIFLEFISYLDVQGIVL